MPSRIAAIVPGSLLALAATRAGPGEGSEIAENNPFRRTGLDGTDVGVDDSALMQSTRPGGDGRR